MDNMINEEENCMNTLSRTSRSLSSPDSQSSFIDETEKSNHKVNSSSDDDNSEGSTASSLKRKLRNLPSPSDGSPFGDRFAYSYNRIFHKKQDLLYQLQEFSNSIEEQDETDVNSATRITSIVDSRLQTPRARRRSKLHETNEQQMPQSSREDFQQFMNQEEFDISQDSSISDDVSGERLRFNEIDQEKSTGERKFDLYRNEPKIETTLPLCLSTNFPIQNPFLSGQRTKKVGGYRPNSILVRNLSSENDSDTENEKISISSSIIRIQELESSSQHHSKITETNKSTDKIDGEFKEFLENLSKNPQSAYSTPRKKANNRNCVEKYFSAPTSGRSDSSELTCNSQKRSTEKIFENNYNNDNLRKENSFLPQDLKKFEIPTLKLRSQDSSLFASSNKTEFQNMKALLSVLSDVSFKQENAFGESGKFRSTHTECRESGFAIERNSAMSPGIQIKSHETSNFKNLPVLLGNIAISRSERFEAKNSVNEIEFLDLKNPNSNNQHHYTLSMETESKIQKSSTILPLQKRSEKEIDEQERKNLLQNETETIVLDNFEKMIESYIGDSNQPEIVVQEPIRITENPSINLFQRSAHFNSMKIAKSDSAAFLDKKSSDDRNLSAKNSSSTSKLSFLLDSMKKENQDRCPFTITESESRNSKEDGEQIPMKEFPTKSMRKSEENFYKLDTHPSITRLALSGTEILPSELIDCVSFENTPKAKNFLTRMRNFLRRISIRLTRKNSSKNSSAKVLFQNDKCRFESFDSSGSQDIKRCSTSSDEMDKQNYSMQRFNSETESCRFSEKRSSRVKSSPVDIISPSTQNHRFPSDDQYEVIDFYKQKTFFHCDV